jgi:SAM-dependent methyltransferase
MSAAAWTIAHGSAERGTGHETVLHSRCGTVISLPSARWWREPGREEEAILDLAIGPVLDLGCGPGRHTVALARRGVRSLGVDSSSAAVAAARARGAAVVHRSVFDRLPDEGRWASALLLDGNVGIGGDPVALLRRVRSLVRADARRGRRDDSGAVLTHRGVGSGLETRASSRMVMLEHCGSAESRSVLTLAAGASRRPIGQDHDHNHGALAR